jgi:hypothetical protein
MPKVNGLTVPAVVEEETGQQSVATDGFLAVMGSAIGFELGLNCINRSRDRITPCSPGWAAPWRAVFRYPKFR